MHLITGVGVLVADLYNPKRILMGKRKSKLGNEEWSFPGGKQEYGETILSAAYREVKEETGLCLDKLQFLFTSYDMVNDTSYTTHHFLSKHKFDGLFCKENREFSKWEIFDMDCLPNNMFLFSKETINYYRTYILKENF